MNCPGHLTYHQDVYSLWEDSAPDGRIQLEHAAAMLNVLRIELLELVVVAVLHHLLESGEQVG